MHLALTRSLFSRTLVLSLWTVIYVLLIAQVLLLYTNTSNATDARNDRKIFSFSSTHTFMSWWCWALKTSSSSSLSPPPLEQPTTKDDKRWIRLECIISRENEEKELLNHLFTTAPIRIYASMIFFYKVKKIMIHDFYSLRHCTNIALHPETVLKFSRFSLSQVRFVFFPLYFPGSISSVNLYIFSLLSTSDFLMRSNCSAVDVILTHVKIFRSRFPTLRKCCWERYAIAANADWWYCCCFHSMYRKTLRLFLSLSLFSLCTILSGCWIYFSFRLKRNLSSAIWRKRYQFFSHLSQQTSPYVYFTLERWHHQIEMSTV